MDDEFPGSIAGYTLERRLSTGGMGAVFLASRGGAHGFEKQVAIKILLPHLFGREGITELFADEARLVARLSHPNICQVFDFGEEAGFYFLVMEYVDGIDLAALLRAQSTLSTPLPQELAARIVADAARGLHHAHEIRSRDGKPLGVVHRDVSPENIVVTREGCVKVLDFGIARWADRIAVTRASAVRGKAAYMSPEQVLGKRLDRRSDIFSLGIVCFELLTGRPLFKRVSITETMRAVVEEPIPDLESLRPEIHPGLRHVVLGALERDLERRFASADRMVTELERAIAELGRPAASEALADYLRRTAFAQSARRLPAAETTASERAESAAISAEATPIIAARRVPAPEFSLDEAVTDPAARDPGPRRRTRRSLSAPALAAAGIVALAALAAVLTMRWTLLPGSAADAGQTETPAAGSVHNDAEDGSVHDRVLAAAAIGAEPAAIDAALTATGVATGSRPSAGGSVRKRPHSTNPSLETQPAAAPDQAAGSAGAISVFASPWGMVRVDGKLLGPTPLLRVALPTGSHVVELVAPDTDVVVERRSVVVTADRELKVRFRSE